MPNPISKYFYRVADVPPIHLTKEFAARFIAGQNILCNFTEQKAGAIGALHKHPAEQIFILLEGTEDHTCGGEKFSMKPGDVCVHPPNVEHGGSTSTGNKGVDIFAPPREDFLELMKKHGVQ